MDQKQEQFMRMQQYQYAPRMPFYMSYPVQNIYMTEMEYERDMERMKELFPEEAKQIQKLVEEECDKMEYEGSMMFDEYPDRVMLKVICDRIYQNATNSQEAQSLMRKELSGAGLPDVEDAISPDMPKQPGRANITNKADTANKGDAANTIDPTDPVDPIKTTDMPDMVNTANSIKATESMGGEGGKLSQQNFWQGPGRPPGPPGPPPPGRPPGHRRRPPRPQPPHNGGLNTLIEVLLYNEMYKRRCRHNRCRRWW